LQCLKTNERTDNQAKKFFYKNKNKNKNKNKEYTLQDKSQPTQSEIETE